MNSNRTPLFIIGGVIVIAIIGTIVYASSQNKNTNTDMDMGAMPGMTHEQDKGTQATGTAGNTAAADSVTIQDYAYSPATITVKVGTTVTWTNKDNVEHTVTTDPGAPAAIESGLFGNGKSFSYTFTKAGTYAYHCQPHPYMKGTVTVTE